MKLVFYLYRKFFPVFLGALFFFSFVLVLVDVLMNLWKFILNVVPASQVFHLMVLYVPKTISFSVPLAVLFSVAFSLSDLYANNELVVIFASGISLIRFTIPLLIISLLLTLGYFFFDDRIVVPTYAEKQSLERTLLKEEHSKDNSKIVVLADNALIIYKADYYNDEKQKLFNLYVVVRDRQKSLYAIIHADAASWNKTLNRWTLQNGEQYTKKGTDLVFGTVETTLLDRLTEIPETFRNNTINVDEVGTKEAKEYIEHLEKAGLPSAEAKSDYYKKFSFPLIIFIVVFISIGLSGRSRKNVLLISLALSVGAAVIFYVMQMVTMLLAKFGYIQPLAGAWIPVIFFIALSAILIRYTRT